ncbi:MAG TPA: hypothetical protein VHW23_06205 [Kofleriaceae bacterium]|jgi:hypothetical protein|nr:hypothetical protein [Kofleriaceae bacterium]
MQIRSIAPSTGPLAAWFAVLFVLSRWVLGAALGAALAGCYAPMLPPGEPCATTDGCPIGQQCVARLCTEAGALPIDAGAPGAPIGNPPDSSPPGDAGSAATCQSSDTCAAAMTLGKVSGDTGNPTLTASGTRAAWFRVRATEDANPSDGSMQILAKLTAPAGENFDVFVYVDPDMDTTAPCPSGTGTLTTGGPGQQVPASWQDFFNDASRNVSIEVRPRSASCSPTAKWQLVIEGNAN